MPLIAIVFGILLTILGIVLYTTSELEALRRLTALIPSVFGLALVLLGQIARSGSDKTRMHTMHIAAVIGLIGLVLPAYRAISALAGGAEVNLAIGGQIVMAVLCGVFLALCVKSFIDARRARKARANGEPTTGPV